jgi:hypothetical protein
MLSREATNTHSIVNTTLEQANHYTTDAITNPFKDL